MNTKRLLGPALGLAAIAFIVIALQPTSAVTTAAVNAQYQQSEVTWH